MNTRVFGIIAGSIGLFMLLIALILGIVIGINDKTQNEYWMDSEDISEDDYTKAEEANAFLEPANMGIAATGMGFLFAGIGLAIAGSRSGNLIVMIIAIVAILILVAGLILSVVMGSMSQEITQISNKDDTDKDDEKKAEDLSISLSFLRTFYYYFSGFTFGSLGMGLALGTILFGAFLKPSSGKGSSPIPPQVPVKDRFSVPTTPGAMVPPTSGQVQPGGYDPTQPKTELDQLFG